MTWYILIMLTLISFISVLFALTDIWPMNPFQERKWLTGIIFITIGGFLRQEYIKRQKTK
jgi:hypothetical protein